jgi:DNA polymerase-3 subunit beta
MKNIEFAVTQKKIMACLQRMAQVVRDSHHMPVISHVLFDVGYTSMEVTGTSLNSWETNTVELSMTAGDPGKFTVNCKKLISIISHMPADDFISFNTTIDGNKVKIVVKWNKSRFTLHGFAGDEFPDAPDAIPNVKVVFDVAGNKLGDYLGGIIHAASLDETRFALNSVCVETVSENRLDVVATDTHRLVRDILVVENMRLFDCEYGFKSLLPNYSVNEIVRMFGKDTGKCTVEFNSTSCRVTGFEGTLVYTTRLLAGKYPNYNKLLTSTEKSWHLMVDTKAVISALKRVATVCPDKVTGVIMSPKDGIMTVSVDNPETNEVATDSFEYESSGSPTIERVGFNLKYMLEMLASMRSDKVSLYITDNESPVQSMSLSRDLKYLNMPMRV